jgi:hypothetical protein
LSKRPGSASLIPKPKIVRIFWILILIFMNYFRPTSSSRTKIHLAKRTNDDF